MPLAGLARATAGLGTALILLHGYPYHRHAAHLGAFPTSTRVRADPGGAPVRTGVRAAAVLAETLELAPSGKILFSGGAQGLPGLHAVGARLFREALARVLGTWVADGAWSLGDAQQAAGMTGRERTTGVRAGRRRVRQAGRPLRGGSRWGARQCGFAPAGTSSVTRAGRAASPARCESVHPRTGAVGVAPRLARAGSCTPCEPVHARVPRHASRARGDR